MDPFAAIKYVTSSATLVAFVTAVIFAAYRYRLKSRKDTIELAPADERAKLVEQTLEFFTIDTNSLTQDQKYNLALRQIEGRAQQFRMAIKASVSIAVIGAVVFLAVRIIEPMTRVTLVANNETSTQTDPQRVNNPAKQANPQMTVAAQPGNMPTPNANTPLSENSPAFLTKIEGDGVAFPVLQFHNFVVKAVDQNGNPMVGVKIGWSTPVGGDKAFVNVTGDDGKASATNLYSFPTPGLYETIASVCTLDTQVGWTTVPAMHVGGPTVRFTYSQQAQQARSGCGNDGVYHETNGAVWNLTRQDGKLQLRRTDNGCWIDFSSDLAGTLHCNNGSSYAVTLSANADCSEITSSLTWFKLDK